MRELPATNQVSDVLPLNRAARSLTSLNSLTSLTSQTTYGLRSFLPHFFGFWKKIVSFVFG